MSIVTSNFNSAFGATQLKFIQQALNKSSQRLSTGKRLNSAGDDPSSVFPAQFHSRQLSGIRQALFNVQDATALVNTMDSTLEEIEEGLYIMRDIALKAMNDATLSPNDFTILNLEFQTGIQSAMSKALNAQYNNINLFNNNEFLSTSAVKKKVQYGPFSTDTTNLVYSTSTGVNYYTSLRRTLYVGPAYVIPYNVSTAADAATALDKVDSAISNTSLLRGGLGIFGKVFDVTLDDLYAQEVNIAAAYSSVVDADMAAEVANFASAQVLADAASAMLAQANTVPARLTSLLAQSS